MQFWPAFASLYNLCDHFQLSSLFAAIVTVFVDVRIYNLANLITDLYVEEKNYRFHFFVKNIR